jgi:ABC-type Fe3+-hydroxamate transport system substrate-binding protein
VETLAESDRKPQFIALFSQLKADVPLRLTRNREPLPVRWAKDASFSVFASVNIDKILAMRPDLVLTFSDLQADIVADLIRRALNVHAFNQRRVTGILDMVRMVGAMVDARERGREACRHA